MGRIAELTKTASGWKDEYTRRLVERDVREIEIGKKCEANDKRQALLGRLGLERGIEDGQQRSSQAQRRPDKKKKDEEMLEVTEKTRFRSLAATLNDLSLDRVGRATCREGNMHEHGEPDTWKLEKIEESMHLL